jgi:histidyl-tRNA synthetase
MELLPPQQIAFQRMLDVIRRGFERFGFLPVETPVFELTDILLTKSGGETEKQVYFVQSTGALERDRGKADAKLPEMALRFDLTVPLARYVAEHEHELNFPFRRYQIQRVYRGERNQKGRYREFYQCDIDAIGKDSLSHAYDAEMPAVIYGVFHELAFGPFTIYVNNRKLLRGILESYKITDELQAPVLHEVDRLGKQDRVKVEDALATLGIPQVTVSRLLDTLTAHAGDSPAVLAALHQFENPTPAFTEGLAELEKVYEGTIALGVPPERCKLNLAIVRGLDYYTGTVYETFLDEHPGIGSICSGGRYDNLAGHYSKSKLPGVGISIGATRLFYQLLEAKLIEATKSAIADVIILGVEAKLAGEYAAIATELRSKGLNVEVYGGEDKLAKQFKYADRANVEFAVLLGAREQEAGVVKVKELRVKQEHEVPRKELADWLARRVQAG